VIAYIIDVAIVLALALALVKSIGWVAAYGLAIVLVQLLYFAAFEGSGLQASPGKLLLGLRVVSNSGDGISFGRALARNTAKSVTATLGFLFRLLRGRAAYHDALADTVVLRQSLRSSFDGYRVKGNRAWRCAGWAIVGVIFTIVVLQALVTAFTLSVTVEGYAMAPTYMSGQRIMAVRTSYLFSSPRRGDVIVFRAVSAGVPDRVLIDRIVGLPGDRVAIGNGTVYVNDHPLSTPIAWQPPTYHWGPEIVPAGHYFVLGDNRSDSFDSHDWPVSPWVARGDIVGKVN
jgi:signal peptidase I